MTSLGEISLDLKANTSQFDTAVRSATGVMGKATTAAAGLAAGAAVIVGGLAAAGSAAFAFVSQIASMGDEAAKAAARMGTTAEVVQELKHAAELSGSSIGDVEKAFKSLNKNATDAADGTMEAVDAFRRIGVQVEDANGSLKSSEQLFMESADAISQMKNSTEQAAAAQEVFGKAGTKLLPMLKSGAAGIADMRKEARDLGIVMSNDAAASSEHFNDTLDRLNKSFEGIKIQIGSALLPSFTKLADIVLAVTRRFFEQVDVAKYMQDGLRYLTKGALSLLDGLIEFAPVLAGVATAMRVASNMGQLWLTGLVAIGKLIAGLALTIGEFVTGSLSGFVGGVSEVAAALGKDELAGSLRTAEKGIADVAKTMGGLATASFDSLADSVSSAADDFGDIDSAISDLANGSATSALRGTLTGIRETVDQVGNATLDTAKKFESGADSMVKSAKKIASALKEVALGYADMFLAEQQASRDVSKAGTAEQNRISSSMGAAVLNADEVRATSAAGAASGGGIDTAAKASESIGKLAQSSQLASAGLAVMTGGVSGLVDVFVRLWAGSEKMQQVFALMDTFLAPLQRFIDMIGGHLLTVLQPVAELFGMLAPVLDLVLMAMNPIVLPLKLLASLFNALAKPINAFMTAVKTVINKIRVFVHNFGKTKKKNKWEVDENGDIVNKLTKKRIDGSDRRTDREISAANTSGYSELGGMEEAATSTADAVSSLGEAAREAVESLTNVPEIFRANLRRAQASRSGFNAGANGGSIAGGVTGLSNARPGQAGAVIVEGNVVVVSNDPDEFGRTMQRRNFVATGQPIPGVTATTVFAEV